MKYKFLFTFLLITQGLIAQKEDYQWIMNYSQADDCSITNFPESCGASIIDFNYDPPRIIRNQQATMDMDWSNTSFCDSDGQLLFYSNNMQISSGEHTPVPNGERISDGVFWEIKSWPNENQEVKPMGFSFCSSTCIIPQPKDKEAYFNIYVNYEEWNTTARASKYFASLDKDENNEYYVSIKDSVISDSLSSFGYTTCCQHANGRDWWLIQFNQDTAFSFLIDPEGFQLIHSQVFPFSFKDRISNAVFGPKGEKFAIHQLFRSGEPDGTELVLFDFDRCTGTLSNMRFRIEDSFDQFATPGVEFSADGRYLYTNSRTSCYQYDTREEDIFSSRKLVMKWDSSVFDNPFGQTEFASTFGLSRRGPDNKIYIANPGQNTKFHVINRPNNEASLCKPEQNAITLPTLVIGTVSTFPTLRLGPLDGSPCDTLGLDNHPVSRFRYEQDSSDFLSLDFVDLSFYEPTDWSWSFGDGQTSTERFPSHSYEQAGVYEVCQTVSNLNSSHTSCDTLFLGVSSLEDVEEKRHITVFPNPVEDMMRVAIHDYLPQQAIIRLYNLEGQLVVKQALSGVTELIDLSSLTSGVYVYKLYDGVQHLGGGKVVKM